MKVKYYELHQTPHESKTAKLIFVVGLHDLDLTIFGKPKTCVYGLGFARKRPNPHPSPKNYKDVTRAQIWARVRANARAF